jgi:ABC-type Mn2+/Zn2+ transport system permease subunit
VIGDFLDSWALFQTTYLTGWLIAVVLSVVGVWVVARDQIFLGVAVAQASTLGIALALWLGELSAAGALGWLRTEAVAAALAVTASVVTALLTTRSSARRMETAEAVTGWVFLVAASLPVLLLAGDPHGLEEVHQLLFSTILGATDTDLAVFVLLATTTAALVAACARPLLLFALDPAMAIAAGLSPRRWNVLLAIWLGIAVGLSIRVSGTLYTFGCLVLPALVAKHLVREVRPLLWLAPALALSAAVSGFVLANTLDTPPAHTTVALLCGALPLAWLTRRLRARQSA